MTDTRGDIDDTSITPPTKHKHTLFIATSDTDDSSSCENVDTTDNNKQCSSKQVLPEDGDWLDVVQTSILHEQSVQSPTRWKASSLLADSETLSPCTSPFRADKTVPNNECLLHQKLADVLLELACEKENLYLAASAGNALLEQLGGFQIEQSMLREKLKARDAELEAAARENARLKNMCTAMEIELRQYDKLWTELQQRQSLQKSSTVHSGEGMSPNLTQPCPPNQRTSSICSVTRSHSPTSPRSESCRRCEGRAIELKTVLQENDELKRRCVDLEVQHERLDSGWTELSTLHKKNEGCLKRVQTDYAKALADIDYMTQQLKLLKDDHCQLISTRDNLRAMNHRLKTENETLRHSMSESSKSLQILEAERNTIVMQQQILENRLTSLVHENDQLVKALSQCQAQLHADQAHIIDTAVLERQTKDLEHLLEEANKQLNAARYDSQVLVRRLLETTAFDGPNGSKSVRCGTTIADVAGDDTYAELQHKPIGRRQSVGSQMLGQTPLVLPKPSITRRHSTVDLSLSKRSSQRRRRRSYTVDDDSRSNQFDAHGVEGNLMTLATPLYVGLSLVACATAVRYFFRR